MYTIGSINYGPPVIHVHPPQKSNTKQIPNLALSFGAVREMSICGLRPPPVRSPSSTCLGEGGARPPATTRVHPMGQEERGGKNKKAERRRRNDGGLGPAYKVDEHHFFFLPDFLAGGALHDYYGGP